MKSLQSLYKVCLICRLCFFPPFSNFFSFVLISPLRDLWSLGQYSVWLSNTNSFSVFVWEKERQDLIQLRLASNSSLSWRWPWQFDPNSDTISRELRLQVWTVLPGLCYAENQPRAFMCFVSWAVTSRCWILIRRI